MSFFQNLLKYSNIRENIYSLLSQKSKISGLRTQIKQLKNDLEKCKAHNLFLTMMRHAS